jgi:hypothetical protein
MDQWEKLATTDLATILRESNISVNSQPAPELISRKPPFSRKELQGDFKKWYITFFFVLVESVLNLVLVLGNISLTQGLYNSVRCVFFLPSLINMVLTWVLLYKYWEVVQDGNASTSPAKAIGFMFIPFFNFYWVFRAYWRLSKDINRYITTVRGKVKRQFTPSNEKLTLSYAVLFLVSYSYSVMIVLVKFIVTKSSTFTLYYGKQPFPTWLSIIGQILILVWFVIEGLVYIDLYRATNSILQVQEIE